MPKLEILIGMIASGKSTYARSRAAEGALIISHDDLTEMLHGQYRYEPELKPLYLKMMQAIAMNAIRAGKDIIVDRTHLTRESRAVWVELGRLWKFSGVQVLAVTFAVESPIVHAERRFHADPRGRTFETWLGVANHHYRQHLAEPLNWPAEGFDGVVTPAFENTDPHRKPIAEAPQDLADARCCDCGHAMFDHLDGGHSCVYQGCQCPAFVHGKPAAG